MNVRLKDGQVFLISFLKMLSLNMHIILLCWYKLGVHIIFGCHFLPLGYSFPNWLYLFNLCNLFFTKFLVLSIKYFQYDFTLWLVSYACASKYSKTKKENKLWWKKRLIEEVVWLNLLELKCGSWYWSLKMNSQIIRWSIAQ